MRRFPAFLLLFGILAIAAVVSRAQDGPPGGPDDGGPDRPPRRDGPGDPDGPGGGGPPWRMGPGGQGGPGGFRAGFHLIPPFAVEKLNLTEDQQQQVAALEKETKAKLYKILTTAQRKTLETARPPRPGMGGPGGQGAFGGRRGPRGPGGGPDDDSGGPGGPGGGRHGPGGGPGGPGGPGGGPDRGGPDDDGPDGGPPARPQRPASE
ncbi:MAG: hypothetical protein ACLQNE_11240 [Thermoguttaceae bacterium]